MSNDLTDRERRALQKAAMLEEFDTVRKKNIIAALLCIFLGIWGAHRFYLGQYTYGGFILLATIALIGLSFAAPFDLLYWNLGRHLLLVVFLLWLFEIFRVSGDTDKVNARKRAVLEEKYYAFV